MQTKKPKVRDKILSTAKAQFLANGFERADMRGIASKAGFTVGNIYRYFDGKEALFISVLNEPSLTTTHERLVMEAEQKLNNGCLLLRHLDSFTDSELRAMIAGIS